MNATHLKIETHRIAFGVGGTIVIIAVGIALSKNSALRAVEAEIARLHQGNVLARGEPSVGAQGSTQLTEPEARSRPVVSDDLQTIERAPRTAPTYDWVVAGSRFLALHPEFRRALDADFRLNISNSYRRLYSDLNLTPQQVERFERLRLEFMLKNVTTRDGPLGFAGGTGRLQARETTREAVEGQLEEVLGEEGYRRYAEYNRKMGVFFAERRVWQELFDTDVPLSNEQGEHLIEILAESSPAYRNGGRAGRFSIDWDHVEAGAEAVLSPSQMRVLQRVADQERYAQLQQFVVVPPSRVFLKK